MKQQAYLVWFKVLHEPFRASIDSYGLRRIFECTDNDIVFCLSLSPLVLYRHGFSCCCVVFTLFAIHLGIAKNLPPHTKVEASHTR